MEWFACLAVLSIAAGGMVAAFSARRPSRFVMWLTAYLVLICGLVQLGMVIGTQQLHLNSSVVFVTSFILYNLANVAVITGRALKGRTSRARYIVYCGGALLAVSMLLLISLVYRMALSWTLAWFLGLVVVILVSMPIGLVLSSRRQDD